MAPAGRRAAARAAAAAVAAVAAAAASAVAAAAAPAAAAAAGGTPLVPFTSCSALLDSIRGEAVARVGPYGMGGGRFGEPLPWAAGAAEASADAAPAEARAPRAAPTAGRGRGGGGEAGVDFSDTNSQVEGVAEADIVKTDGAVVYALRGRSLRVVTAAAGGAGGVETGVLSLDEFPTDMLLGGERLLIVASSYGALVPTPTPTPFVGKPRPIPVDAESVDEPVAEPEPPGVPADVEEEEEDEELGDAIPEVAVSTDVADETAAVVGLPAPDDAVTEAGLGVGAPAARVEDDDDDDDDDDDAAESPTEETPLPCNCTAGCDGASLPPGAIPKRPAGPHRGEITIVYTVDVSNARAPKVVSVTRMQGRYVSSRSVDGVARLVLASAPPASLPYTRPGVRPRPGRFVPGLSEAQAEAANKALVRGTVLEDWFPRYRTAPPRGVRGGVTTGFIASCARSYRPATFAGFDLLSIVTLPLAAGAPASSLGRGTAVFAGGDTVYSSVGSVYVTTTNYRERFPIVPFGGRVRPVIFDDGASFNTSIHQFGLDDGTVGATYLGSGVVAGSVLNQFSMHETNGTFFIATTLGAPWWRARNTSVSEITAFRRADGAPTDAPSPLVQVGKVGDLGRGERIYAVRYLDDTAYVVTFRQVDPLYIISLADPTALVATGELKIPGFSSYLHPVGPGRLLGVGQDATPTGRTTGVKVTLFDVSDVRAPRELATWAEPDFSSASSVQWDHRAFLYWPPARLAVLPVQSYGDGSFTGSVVLRLSDTRITEAGRVTHPPRADRREWEGDAGEAVERNLVLGREWLWSLSRSRFQVQALDGLRVSGSVVFSKLRDAE